MINPFGTEIWWNRNWVLQHVWLHVHRKLKAHFKNTGSNAPEKYAWKPKQKRLQLKFLQWWHIRFVKSAIVHAFYCSRHSVWHSKDERHSKVLYNCSLLRFAIRMGSWSSTRPKIGTIKISFVIDKERPQFHDSGCNAMVRRVCLPLR